MIPYDNIVEWRATTAPWVDDAQVEQDLVLSRAVVSIFNDPWLHDRLAFRGGTVLHKCLLPPAARYSNDIDLVMSVAEPIGPVFDRLRTVLAWIGKDKTAMSTNIGTITFAFPTTSQTPPTMKVKVEINSREHEPRFGFHDTHFAVANTWFTGATTLRTYQLEELLGTKLRALHQRRKGRDLFDLDYALRHPTVTVDPTRVREAFLFYMQNEAPLTRTAMEQSLAVKMQHPGFLGDITPLLRPGIVYDARSALSRVSDELIAPLPQRICPVDGT
jgi:predicted nucleotidyltransferase component of viral defense system